MNLTIIGAGFVGLVTAAVFADFKNQVWVVDNDKDKIKKLSSGKIPFYEPGLEKLIVKNFKSDRLKFTTDYSQAIPNAEIIFIRNIRQSSAKMLRRISHAPMTSTMNGSVRWKLPLSSTTTMPVTGLFWEQIRLAPGP